MQVGDAWQLPPCGCRHKQDEEDSTICHHCHLLYSNDFLSAQHQHLQAVYRQAADPTFTRFLNYIRTRRPTPEYIQEVLGACMRDKEELTSLLTPDATVLCTHRWVNTAAVSMLHALAVEACPGYPCPPRTPTPGGTPPACSPCCSGTKT
jgi:hypothetical protein